MAPLNLLPALMELPSWVQFFLTLLGGWLLGVGSTVVAFWRRMILFERRIEGRIQAAEQTLYGRRGEEGGLVAQVKHADSGIDRIEKLLVRVCEHLKIPNGGIG